MDLNYKKSSGDSYITLHSTASHTHQHHLSERPQIEGS